MTQCAWVKVFVIELPQDVSGLTCLVGRSGKRALVPVVVVNGDHDIERRRMTLAHGLAHWVIVELLGKTGREVRYEVRRPVAGAGSRE